jgi:hypothetical protein
MGNTSICSHACCRKLILQIKRSKKDYQINQVDRFRYRTRYFSDSGIIGTKEFVAQNYQRFKHHFQSKNDKIPKLISGLDGVYSLKRLSAI